MSWRTIFAPAACRVHLAMACGACAALTNHKTPSPHPPPPQLPPCAGMESTRHNYLLLGLAVFQFPLNAWLARLPAA